MTNQVQPHLGLVFYMMQAPYWHLQPRDSQAPSLTESEQGKLSPHSNQCFLTACLGLFIAF